MKEKTSFFKWMALFVLVFTLSLPVTAKESFAGTMYSVSVSKGYLALRTAKAYDSSNEIGELYTGDTVEVMDTSDNTYWYVYSAKLGKSGYVNRNYLVAQGGGSYAGGSSYTVSVSKGYLALRTAKAYDSKNEIGELYSGDTVQVQDTSDSTYWYVYAPKLGKSGYVNRNYLVGGGSYTGGSSYTVSVSSGYLALRTAKAYDSSNEIGELYSGDLVEVLDYTGATGYWYVYSPKYDDFGYVNNDYLDSVTSSVSSYDTMWTVSVSTGYLALRNAPEYDASNEIGELYSGDTVWVSDSSNSQYWYVYSPKLDGYGYVNQEYLYREEGLDTDSSYFGEIRTVSVAKGYLALRNMKAYDASNEIGELYSGDTVQLLDTSDSQYWYVYSPKYDTNGFVNKDYLVGGNAYATLYVKVPTGYLALRSAMGYDAANEIGELNTGDTVVVIDSSSDKYWYVYSPRLMKYGYADCNYIFCN